MRMLFYIFLQQDIIRMLFYIFLQQVCIGMFFECNTLQDRLSKGPGPLKGARARARAWARASQRGPGRGPGRVGQGPQSNLSGHVAARGPGPSRRHMARQIRLRKLLVVHIY